MEFTLDKELYICVGSNCKHSGSQEPLKAWMLKKFSPNEIGRFNCINRCDENYAFFYKNKAHSAKTEEKFLEIINSNNN